MPPFLSLLSVVGTVAMLWVGSILIHGLAEFGWHAPEHLLHDLATTLAHLTGPLEPATEWLFIALGSGALGFLGSGSVPVGATLTGMSNGPSFPERRLDLALPWARPSVEEWVGEPANRSEVPDSRTSIMQPRVIQGLEHEKTWPTRVPDCRPDAC